jgi:hypothetical protein
LRSADGRQLFSTPEGSTDMSSEKNRTSYTAPTLKVYGDVRKITLAFGNMGTDDGGMGATDKTST